MSDLSGLYQEMILDHCKRPRNFRVLEEATAQADGYNPLCGDRVTVYLRMNGDEIGDIAFKGSGCAISTASASLLTEALKGKTRAQAEGLFDRFRELVTGESPRPPESPSALTRQEQGKEIVLGKLEVFSGVSEFPARVKCATLAWHTMKSALDGDAEPATTETGDPEDQAAR